MSTMTDNETYNGYANRETWAFNLHWQNDQGLYTETLEYAKGTALGYDPEISDAGLGELVVTYWRDMIDSWVETFGSPVPLEINAFEREVGSWWRINYAEVGAAVRESLDAESSS